MMPSIMSGSLIRDTPPCARMSAGTRSSAITATAPASSAIFACSGVTTSMITPPFSISAIPRLTRAVPVSATFVTAGLLAQIWGTPPEYRCDTAASCQKDACGTFRSRPAPATVAAQGSSSEAVGQPVVEVDRGRQWCVAGEAEVAHLGPVPQALHVAHRFVVEATGNLDALPGRAQSFDELGPPFVLVTQR